MSDTALTTSIDIEKALPPKTDVEQWAQKTFDRLCYFWEIGLAKAKNQDENKKGWLFGDYWKAGNTLDAAINYLVVTRKTDETSLVQRSHDYVYFPREKYPHGAWRDDYGWWGNAFVNAYKNSKNLGLTDNLRTKCRAAAENCWKVLDTSARENESYKSKAKYIGEGYAAWNEPNSTKMR
jgi:hypothetical protein